MNRRSEAMKNRKKGFFTLVEIIVAMAIMIFVALIIASASMTFYNAWQRSVRISERLKTYQTIDRIMDTCVRNMIPFTWRDEDLNQERVVFKGEPDNIHFVALRRAYRNDKGALIFLRIRVENEQLIAEYSQYPRFQWNEEETEQNSYTREVLADRVRSVSFRYATEENDELVWDDTWEEDLNINVAQIATEVEERLRGCNKSIKVAVMGCIVNGPGEAKGADIGIAGGKDCAMLFVRGEQKRMLRGDIVEQLCEEIEKLVL